MRLPAFIGVGVGALLLVAIAWRSFALQRQEFEATLLRQERLLDQRQQELRTLRARSGCEQIAAAPKTQDSGAKELDASPKKQDSDIRRLGPRSHCAKLGMLTGTELRGRESSHHAAASAEDCPALCEADESRCIGWTFNAEEKLCRLKASVESEHNCHVCTSWKAPDAAKPEPEPLACRAPEIQGALASAHEAFERGLASARASQKPSGRPYDIVLVIAWQRAAMLLAALDFVLRAEFAEQHVYVFQLDHGFSPEVLAVACAWPLEKRIVFPPPHR
eukprot:COSAG02_NODE_16057_length_1117_cov_1.103143_1_plen_276_part_01